MTSNVIVGIVEWVIVGLILGAIIGTWAKRTLAGKKGDDE